MRKNPNEVPCPHNPMVTCDPGPGPRCGSCGWSPAGEKARKKAIREREKNGMLMKEGYRGKIC